MPMGESVGKILVIGLDGATWDLIRPWIEEGRLPTLRTLTRRGSRGVLESTTPPVSPLAWSTFLTGTNPGKHGIYGFIKRIEGKYRWRTVTALDRVARPLWAYTDAQGLKTAFLYVPITYPPSPLNGVMISGLGTPWVESDFAYPPELKAELLARFDRRYLVEPLLQGSQEQALTELLTSIDVQAEILRYIVAQDSYDLAVFVFGQTDRVQHFYWKEMDSNHPDHDPSTPEVVRGAIQAVYERIDAAIGRICDLLDEDTTLIIMSDHGFGPYQRDVYLNNWLAHEGFLAYKDSDAKVAGSGPFGWFHNLTYKTIGMAEGRVPRRIVWPLRKYGFISRLDDFNANPAAAEIDWSRTRVYSADYWGYVYLNLEGREPAGVVKPGPEARALLGQVRNRLRALTDPETQQPIVRRVYGRGELYSGPMAEESPDLVVECMGQYHCKPQPMNQHELVVARGGKYRHLSLDHSAIHRPAGIVLLAGPMIRQGHRLVRANIADLAPTILYLLGCPLSETFDGLPLVEAIQPEWRREMASMLGQPLGDTEGHSALPGYSDDEARKLEERLRGLGYL